MKALVKGYIIGVCLVLVWRFVQVFGKVYFNGWESLDKKPT